jgi:hypothetical protein
MIEFDKLEKEFAIKPAQLKLSPTPHELKPFFDTRRIHYAKIAKVLELGDKQKAYISYWLAGSRPIPKDKEESLYVLKQMFDKWEKIHGRIFNHNVMITNNTIPIDDSKCPYEKHGIKFGIDYNEYDVCDKCDLKSECSECHVDNQV